MLPCILAGENLGSGLWTSALAPASHTTRLQQLRTPCASAEADLLANGVQGLVVDDGVGLTAEHKGGPEL